MSTMSLVCQRKVRALGHAEHSLEGQPQRSVGHRHGQMVAAGAGRGWRGLLESVPGRLSSLSSGTAGSW